MNRNSTPTKFLRKLFHNEIGRTLIVPLDHGVHDGPIPGLVNMERTISLLAEEKVDAIVLHKGMLRRYRHAIGDLGTFLHLSASTSIGTWLKKVIVATVDEAVDLKANGVSVHVNFGNDHEPMMLRDLGKISRECESAGKPLLVMAYVRREAGGKVYNSTDAAEVKHVARVAAELGATIVKVPFTGTVASFTEVVEGCHVPVVMAGGTVGEDRDIVEALKMAVDAGGAGASIGRYVFQAPDPKRMIAALRNVLFPKEEVVPIRFQDHSFA